MPYRQNKNVAVRRQSNTESTQLYRENRPYKMCRIMCKTIATAITGYNWKVGISNIGVTLQKVSQWDCNI